MDKFPEAFRRFEEVVDIRRFRSYRDLRYAFGHWAGKRWRNTWAQNSALAYEGRRLGFKDVFIPISYARRKVIERKWRKGVIKKVQRKYRGIGKVRMKALNWYISRGYSANKIQRRLKARGLGIRRKTLLKIVREIRLKTKRVSVKKYIPKKYRKRSKKR